MSKERPAVVAAMKKIDRHLAHLNRVWEGWVDTFWAAHHLAVRGAKYRQTDPEKCEKIRKKALEMLEKATKSALAEYNVSA